MHLARSITIGLGVLALAAGVCLAAPVTSYHAQGPYRFKDFAVVYDRGLFHAYAIHECESPGSPGTCDTTRRGFLHLTSPDLTHWTEVGFVLPPDERPWRSYDVWAPSIVERDGTFYMFYTAVERQPDGLLVQRISVATSTDLYAWTDARAAPLFGGDLFDWAYWDLSSTDGIGADCRDPFVTWDAGHQTWVMLVAVRIVDGTVAPPSPPPMVIGVATSPDLEHWTAAGRLDDTKGPVAESPHLLEHAGAWRFFWTADTIMSASATDPTGPLTDVGPPTGLPAGAFASEALQVGDQGIFMAATSPANTLEFRRIDWTTDPVALGPIGYGEIDVQAWNDDDENGLRGPTEPGLNGVTVEVLRDDGDGSFTPGGEWPYAMLVTGDVPGLPTGSARLTTTLPGRYFVMVDPLAFEPGGLMAGLVAAPVQTLDVAAGGSAPAPIALANAMGPGQSPSLPVAMSPLDGQQLTTTTATLQFIGSDPERDSLVYDLQIDRVPTFDSSDLRLARSRASSDGWSGTGGPWLFASGAPATYVARHLRNGVYYWRVRAVDPLGSGMFSDFGPVMSFSTPPALTLSAPEVSCPAASVATIEWTSSNPGSSNVWYHGDADYQLSLAGADTLHRVDLSGLTPGTTYSYYVWTVDGFGQIATSAVGSFETPTTTTGVDSLAFASALALAPPSPNPSSRRTVLRFNLPRPGAATLVLCDVHGRRVAGWEWAALAAGPHQVEWDGRADDGRPAPAGVLFGRLIANGQTRTQKLVLLK